MWFKIQLVAFIIAFFGYGAFVMFVLVKMFSVM